MGMIKKRIFYEYVNTKKGDLFSLGNWKLPRKSESEGESEG
jgi:hypothetical protein